MGKKVLQYNQTKHYLAEEPMQEIRLIRKEPEIVFALSGEIDSGNADEFYEEVTAVYSNQGGNLVFNCAELEFIDSTTLGTFVKLLKKVKQDGYTLRITEIQPRLKKLFVICALDQIMEIEP
jgi:anti-sigma B factor antagonist